QTILTLVPYTTLFRSEIRNLDNESKRSNALETLFRDGTKAGERVWKEYKERVNRYSVMSERLRTLAAEGKTIRIWYGKAPYEVRSEEHTSELQSRFDL